MNRGVALLVVLALSCLFHAGTADAATIRFVEKSRSDKLIVFVHGVLGDPLDTFRNQKVRHSWPDMVASDSTAVPGSTPLSHFDVAVVQYDAGVTSTLSIEQLSNQISSDFETAGFWRYNDIFVIAHSMGGLITKRLIVDLALVNSAHLRRFRALFLISTPSKGAEAANFVSRIAELGFGLRPVVDMRTIDSNTFLQTLENQWELVYNTRASELPSVFCMYETEAIIGRIIIVPQIFASTRCSEPGRAEGRDHWTIVKPKSPTDPIYTWVKGGIAKTLAGAPPLIRSREPLEVKLKLFDERDSAETRDGLTVTELRPRPRGDEVTITSPQMSSRA